MNPDHIKGPTCEDEVISKIQLRRAAGLKKYGVSMERTDLTKLEWLQHAQDEAMDCAIYLQKLMRLEQHRREVADRLYEASEPLT